MTAARPFGWAVVGLGKHTRTWVAPAILASETGRLVAVVSRDTDRATRIVAEWGAPTVYGTLGAALTDPDVDGVWLVTPNNLHRAEVEACAAAGKHVLCEKPLAITAEDCQAMVDACERAGVGLGVGFHLRHNLVHERARELVAAGEIGDVTFASVRYFHRTAPDANVTPATASDRPDAVPTASASWRKDPAISGGGAFMGNGVHTIDLLRYLTGREIVDVSARSDRTDAPETVLEATAALDGGAVGFLAAGDVAYPVNEVVLNGTGGTISCVGSVGNVGEGSLHLVTASGPTTFTPAVHNVYSREADAFVARVRERRAPDASGADGVRSASVVEAIYSSTRSGDRVAVAQFTPNPTEGTAS